MTVAETVIRTTIATNKKGHLARPTVALKEFRQLIESLKDMAQDAVEDEDMGGINGSIAYHSAATILEYAVAQ